MKQKKTKFIFVTGGVVSSLGKGITASSIGALMEARGFRITLLKMDPYINVDPGTMSPFQHGEVFVTDDGAETDLDLGHYERFTTAPLTRANNFTTGQVYDSVITKERKGEYLGKTVQVIPHITNEIKEKINAAAQGVDLAIVEVGGTVGDIESQPFLEAIRQLRGEFGRENTLFVHLTLVPYIGAAHEIKTATGRDGVAVFVPNSPNATAGFLVFVPREEVIELKMSVEDALKMVVSLGVVTPGTAPEPAAAPLARP